MAIDCFRKMLVGCSMDGTSLASMELERGKSFSNQKLLKT
jgi:hypothetical protein